MSIVINSDGRFDDSEALEFTDIDAAIDPVELDGLLDAPAIRIVFGWLCGRSLSYAGQTAQAARLH